MGARLMTSRRLNEELGALARRWGEDSNAPPQYEFVCECSQIDCGERIRLSVREYERIRENGRYFVVAPRHVLLEIEEVIEKRDYYSVIAKRD